jgi:hypothetical protein
LRLRPRSPLPDDQPHLNHRDGQSQQQRAERLTDAMRDDFRIALLGWSEAQRNPQLRATMRGFYMAFRDKLAQAGRTWAATGLISPESSSDDVSKALLAVILGFVVQAALLGDVAPAAIGVGVAQLSLFSQPPPRSRRSGRGQTPVREKK